MKLSILICTVPDRREKLEKLLAHLDKQITDRREVEVKTFETKTSKEGGPHVGDKRNYLLAVSTGEYVCWLDDDDWVSDDYVQSMLDAMRTSPDCVTFKCLFTNEDIGHPTQVYFGRVHSNRNVEKDGNGNYLPFEKRHRTRMVNHLNPVKRSIVEEMEKRTGKPAFPDATFGEDNAYALKLKPYLRTEVNIDRILYHYNFSPRNSHTHHLNGRYRPALKNKMVKMDVVIVSDGTQEAARKMTQEAVNSVANEGTHVVVVERCRDVKYENAETVPQPAGKFNYNRCLNVGALQGNADLVCFSNNDVVFPRHFLKQMMEDVAGSGADVMSVTTQKGYIPMHVISGFCFVMTRRAYERVGELNEDYNFWCADNVATEQFKEHKLKMVKNPCRVHHLVSYTLNQLDERTAQEFKEGCVKAFNRDYDQNVLNMGKAAPALGHRK